MWDQECISGGLRGRSRERQSLAANHWPALHQALCASAPPSCFLSVFCLLLQSLSLGISARQESLPKALPLSLLCGVE